MNRDAIEALCPICQVGNAAGSVLARPADAQNVFTIRVVVVQLALIGVVDRIADRAGQAGLAGGHLHLFSGLADLHDPFERVLPGLVILRTADQIEDLLAMHQMEVAGQRQDTGGHPVRSALARRADHVLCVRRRKTPLPAAAVEDGVAGRAGARLARFAASLVGVVSALLDQAISTGQRVLLPGVFGDSCLRKFCANNTCAPGLVVRLQQAALDPGVAPCPTSLSAEPRVSISRNGLASTLRRFVHKRERRTMISQFQHILVPVDFTERNRAALDIVFEIAVDNRARVTLLHVIETIDDVDIDDDEVRDFYAKLQQRAERELEALSRRFSDTDIAVERNVRYGKRAQEIVQDSLDRPIDLIVMGSHTIDVEQPTKGWATLSYQVSVLCQCPVLLVK